MIFSSMISTSFIIIFIKHPLSLGILIVMYTTLISLTLGLFSSFWYFYIIFLILIGGLLVLFIYMTSIASNEKFKINIFLFLSMSMIFSSTMVYSNVTNSCLNEISIKNTLTNQMKYLNNFYSMSKFLFYPSIKLFVITILFFLITLIATIKICKLNNGPLRQMFYDMMPLRKNSPSIKIINTALIDLSSPSNISTLWNFGSLLSICLMIQNLTGIFLAMHYCPDINYAFNSVSHICHDINHGWFIRTFHANVASMFFICLYIHVGRGLYYSSFELLETWTMGY